MAIVATLNEAENRHAPSAHSIASIPLNKLVPWDGNVRKTNGALGIAELAANIAAVGLLQSLVVRKANRGKYAIIAGRRRYLALSSLADSGTIAIDAPVPCRIVPGSSDATEIGLAENVMRAPMHPADQFEAYRALIDDGSSPAEVAARFGINETGVKQRLKLARVTPAVFEAYRAGELNLDQVQAFAVSDDHAAQERIFTEMAGRDVHPSAIRRALTEGEVRATDKRVKFVTVAAYEEAGGAVRRDLFTEGDDGIFILDAALLDKLTIEKLEAAAEQVRLEGWKWVEPRLEFGYDAKSEFYERDPDPLPMSEEAAAEQKRLSTEYQDLFENGNEDDEARSDRLDEIEERIEELEDTESAYTPETLATGGAVVSIDHKGELDITRGLVRPEDEPESEPTVGTESGPKEKPPFSASLVASLTACRSLAISATMLKQPDVALAAVTHALVVAVLHKAATDSSCLQISVKLPRLEESCKGKEALDVASEAWKERLPSEPGELWSWCVTQDRDTLLDLLAFCTAHAVDGVERKGWSGDGRVAHAQSLARALSLDMAQWFTPTKENYFLRVGRTDIATAISEARQTPHKRSWDKMKKSEFAVLAEQEIAGTSWLPQPLRVAA
jgi:ParB family transcriptional regulator, chromosome partitioning protein